MVDGTLWRLFWRVADQFDDLVTLAWLRILDALAGPLPETPAESAAAARSGEDKKGFPRDRALKNRTRRG
jgi:hypothetical protein